MIRERGPERRQTRMQVSLVSEQPQAPGAPLFSGCPKTYHQFP
jgi:hypothetical protein